MRIISLNYHDVVTPGDPEPTGRSVPGAWRYNLERDEFLRHLTAIAEARGTNPVAALDIAEAPHKPWPLLLTFDDGGVSAYKCIGDLLERFGWRGNFFVSTNYIGTPGFVSSDQIRDLRKRGHVVGSHSCSHPLRIGHCAWPQLVDEWTRSRAVLGDILGMEIHIASVPGGDFAPQVAEAAAQAGITTLFTSEPTGESRHAFGLTLLGRFTAQKGTNAQTAAALAAGEWLSCVRQAIVWNAKKVSKRVGGEHYLQLRRILLRHGNDVRWGDQNG